MKSHSAELEKEVQELITEDLLEVGPQFTVESNLFEHGLDSMATMQLLILVEERFKISLPAAQLTRENLENVRSVAQLIQAHQANGAE